MVVDVPGGGLRVDKSFKCFQVLKSTSTWLDLISYFEGFREMEEFTRIDACLGD